MVSGPDGVGFGEGATGKEAPREGATREGTTADGATGEEAIGYTGPTGGGTPSIFGSPFVLGPAFSLQNSMVTSDPQRQDNDGSFSQ